MKLARHFLILSLAFLTFSHSTWAKDEGQEALREEAQLLALKLVVELRTFEHDFATLQFPNSTPLQLDYSHDAKTQEKMESVRRLGMLGSFSLEEGLVLTAITASFNPQGRNGLILKAGSAGFLGSGILLLSVGESLYSTHGKNGELSAAVKADLKRQLETAVSPEISQLSEIVGLTANEQAKLQEALSEAMFESYLAYVRNNSDLILKDRLWDGPGRGFKYNVNLYDLMEKQKIGKRSSIIAAKELSEQIAKIEAGASSVEKKGSKGSKKMPLDSRTQAEMALRFSRNLLELAKKSQASLKTKESSDELEKIIKAATRKIEELEPLFSNK